MSGQLSENAHIGTPTLICAFALHRGRYCMRPAGHEKTDGRVIRHDSSQAWVDRHGDVWTLGDDGLLHTPETRPFPREHVEKKWGPLRLNQPDERSQP